LPNCFPVTANSPEKQTTFQGRVGRTQKEKGAETENTGRV
jgi:hypothetical protein